MKIGIAGSNGYLGSMAYNFLKNLGHEVVRINRDNSDVEGNLDVIIDASFPKNYHDNKIFEIYLRNLQTRLKASDAYFIYFGTKSISLKSKSTYSMRKRESELLVLHNSGHVLRIGLIVDDLSPGGRYLQFLKIVSRLPITLKVPEFWCMVHVTSPVEFATKLANVINLLPDDQILETEANLISINELVQNPNRKPILFLSEPWTKMVFSILNRLPLKIFDSLKSIGFKNV